MYLTDRLPGSTYNQDSIFSNGRKSRTKANTSKNDSQTTFPKFKKKLGLNNAGKLLSNIKDIDSNSRDQSSILPKNSKIKMKKSKLKDGTDSSNLISFQISLTIKI